MTLPARSPVDDALDRLRDQLRDALNGRFVGGDVAWRILNRWDDLTAAEARAEQLREERDAAVRGNWKAEPDEEGGKPETYWLRNKLRSAVVHLRDVEDFYRVRSERLGSHNHERANRARGIYEQISEDFFNGRIGQPTMRERAESAEAELARYREGCATWKQPSASST